METALAMLDEMPVAEMSLNELSRRVGLAKSNVLRYFESREAVLLELLQRTLQTWLDEVADELSDDIDPHLPTGERADQMAALLARSLARHGLLCDLVSAQAGVLEHNVSVDVVFRYKRSSIASLETLAGLLRVHVPELGDSAGTVAMLTLILAGALWTHSRPSPSTVAAYEADPTLAPLRLDLPTALENTLTTLITGTLARSGSRVAPR
ncbi:TetR/AcrR family transcriptional regulator [Streptomyces sp. NPDC006668]|uniref:TetR/AcrR family transcriptional regulator n=1 Tax=Streptomyces sp. NPDC006668 TaxID=3156903 RepID=UPI0033CDF5A3